MNFRSFQAQCHNVEIMKFYSTILPQKFRQIYFFTKELHSKLIWRKNIPAAEAVVIDTSISRNFYRLPSSETVASSVPCFDVIFLASFIRD